MVRYKTEPGEKEQKILAEISLNTPNNLKRRKVTSAVSAVLCVIYAAFAGKRYEVGKGTVLELNSSQVSLTQAELTYNQSIYDYLVSKADLDQVLGRDYSTNK